MHVVHSCYFLMFVYMDHVSELKLMYDVYVIYGICYRCCIVGSS